MYHDTTVLIYEGTGYRYRPFSAPVSRVAGGQRGSVLGYSSASTRRLRRYLLTMDGIPRPVWDCTCTLRGDVHTLDVWRSRVDAYGKRLVRLGCCAVWRVELQRRGVPHLHLIVWGSDPASIRHAWLDVWGLVGDAAHEAHAVMIKSPDRDDTAWYAYLAGHTGKHKQDQLGWIGRQWGVWGRSRFRPRRRWRVELPVYQAELFVRYLNTLNWLHGYHYTNYLDGGHLRYCDTHTINRILHRVRYCGYTGLDGLPPLDPSET